MKRLRIFLMNHLGFSRVESNGVIVLGILVLSMAILPRILIRYLENQPSKNEEIDASWIKRIEIEVEEDKSEAITDPRVSADPIITSFNPNEASISQWISVGFTSDQAKRAVNYIKSGGKFYSQSDVAKVYGVTKEQIKSASKHLIFPTEFEKNLTNSRTEIKSINTATAAEFSTIRGIGDKLSLRIIKYRDLLGGFYDFDQLQDVYGLADSLQLEIASKFFIDSLTLRQIPINQIPVDSLWKHPYVEKYQVKAINQYRIQHGSLNSMDDLKKIKVLADSTIKKLAPYIEF